jgi:hypothetical protein
MRRQFFGILKALAATLAIRSPSTSTVARSKTLPLPTTTRPSTNASGMQSSHFELKRYRRELQSLRCLGLAESTRRHYEWLSGLNQEKRGGMAPAGCLTGQF